VTRLRLLDPTAYTHEDVGGTIAAIGPWWAQLVDRRDEAEALVFTQALDSASRLESVAATLSVRLPPVPAESLEAVVAWMTAAGHTLGGAVLRATPALAATVALAMVKALDDLLDAGDRLRASGVMPATATGSVVALHRSDGGVPKQGVESVVVAAEGVIGDRQATRRHHGRPWQALCLWSAEVIEALAAAGHHLAPGHAGENVTITGVPWVDVRSGVRLRLGGVLAEVSVFAIPCAKQARWFSDGQFQRIHHDNGPVSRVYGFVIEPGRITVGDPGVLEPDEA